MVGLEPAGVSGVWACLPAHLQASFHCSVNMAKRRYRTNTKYKSQDPSRADVEDRRYLLCALKERTDYLT